MIGKMPTASRLKEDDAKVPIRKYVIAGSCDSESAVNLTKDTRAENNEPTRMPASTIELKRRFFRLPTAQVSKTAAMPIRKLKPCVPIVPSPSRIPSAAPNEEPLATPTVSGVARGLAKRLWKAAPAADKPAPTAKAVRTRGSLELKTAETAVEFSCFPNTPFQRIEST